MPATTCGGTESSGSVPAESAWNGTPCSAARSLKYSAAIRLLAEAWRQTNNTRFCSGMRGSYFTKTQVGCGIGKAMRPMAAVATIPGNKPSGDLYIKYLPPDG